MDTEENNTARFHQHHITEWKKIRFATVAKLRIYTYYVLEFGVYDPRCRKG
jgi:preprotein translocase subunit SecE